MIIMKQKIDETITFNMMLEHIIEGSLDLYDNARHMKLDGLDERQLLFAYHLRVRLDYYSLLSEIESGKTYLEVSTRKFAKEHNLKESEIDDSLNISKNPVQFDSLYNKNKENRNFFIMTYESFKSNLKEKIAKENGTKTP